MPTIDNGVHAWQITEPEAVGMDADRLLALDHLIQAQYSNINGIVVVRQGAAVFEKYYSGYGPHDRHHVASVTKSILSALIGLAIKAGCITSVNQKVLDFFPDYGSEQNADQTGEISIRHLLTMTAPYPFEDWNEPLAELCTQPDWVRYTLDRLGRQGRIGDFKYATAGAHLLSAIITRSTGQSAREYANEHLFRPIGIPEIPDYKMASYGFEDLFGHKVRGWVHDSQGISTGGWGLTLTPRDMARFGVLYLNRGSWGGQQIVPASWIAESTRMNLHHYGYLWWLREEDGLSAYMALGDGGNMICCIPDKGLVVAVASAYSPEVKDRWMLVKEGIIPAMIDRMDSIS